MSLLRSYLEANAILDAAQLEAATRHMQAQGGSLDTALLELGLLGPGDLDLHLGRACGLPTVPARLLETGPTRPWGHVPKALLDIGWAMPLALEDGNVLVAVHPDLPDARLGQLYRQIRGFMPMVAPECCLAKLAAERSNGIVAPRFAMLMLDVLDALQARDAETGGQPVPEDRQSPAADTTSTSPPPAPGDTLLASAIRRLPAEDTTSSGTLSAASSGTFAAVSLAAHESGTFAASSSGTFPDLRSVGAHAPGTRHGPEPTPRNGTPVPQSLKPAPAQPDPSASSPAPSPSSPAPAQPAPSASSPAQAQPDPSASSPVLAQPAPSTSSPAQAQPAPSASSPAQAQPAPSASSPALVQPAPSASPAAPAAPSPTAAPRAIESASALSAPAQTEPGRAELLAQRLAPARAELAAANERDRITAALVHAAVQIAPRVALFGVRREGLRVLAIPGALPLPSSLVIAIPENSLLDRAVLGLIRLKLLTEPKLAAAVGRPLGIPCLFEPVFAQERGVLMLYIDRDGGLFDAVDQAAVRDLCDLASTNLEALLRTRGGATKSTATSSGPSTAGTAGQPALAATQAENKSAAHPVAATANPAASQPVPTDSSAAAAPATHQAATPVSADSSAAASPAPVPTDSSTAAAPKDIFATTGSFTSGALQRPEVDVPQHRPGRAARAAKRQVISLINPIRRDSSGGYSAQPAARTEPTPDPQRSQPLASPSKSDPTISSTEPGAATTAERSAANAAAAQASPVAERVAQPVPTDRPNTERSTPNTAAPSANTERSTPTPQSPLAERSAPNTAAPSAHTERSTPNPAAPQSPLAERSAPNPAAAEPVPATRSLNGPAVAPAPQNRTRSSAQATAAHTDVPSRFSGIISGQIDDPVATAPAAPDSQAVTRAESPAQPRSTTATESAPDSQAVPRDESPAQPRSTTATESAPPTEAPVPTDSLAAVPPGLHLPNLVAPPGRRGLGKKGDRARHGDLGLVMPDLRRPSTSPTAPTSSTPTPILSIPTSLIAPTPLPGAARRGSRTGLYPVPPRADEITLNMPRLVRGDVARPSAPAADLSSGTAATVTATGTTTTTTTDTSPLAGVVIPADLTRKPASPMSAAPASPPAEPTPPSEPDESLEAATDPTASELSAETSATDAIVEAIAGAMSAAAHAADLEDDLSSETAPTDTRQAAALGSDTATQDADAVIEAYLNAPGDAAARAALGQLGPQGLERIAARFPGPIDLGDQTDARSFPPPSAHGPLLRACVEIGPTITPHILALLEYPRPQLRFYAAFVFQELRDPRCMRALAEHAFDPDADVRLIATRVLESYSRIEGFVAATDLVRSELRSKDRDRTLLAAEAAGTLRDTQAVYTLIELLSVRDKQVRETALEALCSITAKHLGYRPAKWRAWYDEHGQETRVEWVIEALRHRDAAVRRWAADELVRITGHRVTAPAGEKMTAKYLYQAWQQWWAASTAYRGS